MHLSRRSWWCDTARFISWSSLRDQRLGVIGVVTHRMTLKPRQGVPSYLYEPNRTLQRRRSFRSRSSTISTCFFGRFLLRTLLPVLKQVSLLAEVTQAELSALPHVLLLDIEAS